MRVAITGSTGLVGRALVRWFRDRGDSVTRVVRSYAGVPPHERAVVWNPAGQTIEAEGLEGHDVIIHLAGESIAGVWTTGRKRRIRASRVDGTRLLARTIASLGAKPAALFSASAMGYYGNSARAVDESSPPGTGFLADIAEEWERCTKEAANAGVRVVHMRFSNVLSADGGVLGALLPLFRLGLGATFGSGEQCWPWISIDDIGPAIGHLMQHPEIAGPVNFVSPEKTTNAQLTRAIARAVHRPSILAVPAFAARLAPGGMGDEILLGGACMKPRRLLDSGYGFLHPSLDPALKALLRA
ncbi:MAG: TIGR01777 family oxidoreductase [Longimicrobiales bacterium]